MTSFPYQPLPHMCPCCAQSWGGGANCIYNDFTNLCTGNGDVHLLFGSGPYVGLGFMVFGTIVLIEIFGSPFMRNASVALSLLLGYAISSGITYEGKKFVTTDSMASAPAVTFLWTTTFPLGTQPWGHSTPLYVGTTCLCKPLHVHASDCMHRQCMQHIDTWTHAWHGTTNSHAYLLMLAVHAHA